MSIPGSVEFYAPRNDTRGPGEPLLPDVEDTWSPTRSRYHYNNRLQCDKPFLVGPHSVRFLEL
jgi:hypothetical protein